MLEARDGRERRGGDGGRRGDGLGERGCYVSG